jgi:tungstate transport system ATP-binding protein
MEDVIQEVVARGIKVVMSIHDLGEARRLPERLCSWIAARVIENDLAAPCFSDPRTPEARYFIAGELLV